MNADTISIFFLLIFQMFHIETFRLCSLYSMFMQSWKKCAKFHFWRYFTADVTCEPGVVWSWKFAQIFALLRSWCEAKKSALTKLLNFWTGPEFSHCHRLCYHMCQDGKTHTAYDARWCIGSGSDKCNISRIYGKTYYNRIHPQQMNEIGHSICWLNFYSAENKMKL